MKAIMKTLTLFISLVVALSVFGQEGNVAPITKENKKRILAELKAYMKNPQLYIEEKNKEI